MCLFESIDIWENSHINISTESGATLTDSTSGINVPPASIQRECQLCATNMQHEMPVVIGSRPVVVPATPNMSLNQDYKPVNTQQRASATGYTSRKCNKILLIGDSILNGVNPKGLHQELHKHTTGGATVSTLIEEVAVYDLKSFSHVVVSVEGNDAARHTHENRFEEQLDQLLSIIKCANENCIVIVCKVAPRGDVDVTAVNTSIGRLADHWKQQKVQCCEYTHDLLLAKNGQPTPRYYGNDGIHLSHAGTKRLLDGTIAHVK